MDITSPLSFLEPRSYMRKYLKLNVELMSTSELDKRARKFCMRHFDCRLPDQTLAE